MTLHRGFRQSIIQSLLKWTIVDNDDDDDDDDDDDHFTYDDTAIQFHIQFGCRS